MKVNFFESSDANAFAPFTVNPESVSVVDASICFEFTSEDNAAFFQFSLEQSPTLTPGAGMWGCRPWRGGHRFIGLGFLLPCVTTCRLPLMA